MEVFCMIPSYEIRDKVTEFVKMAAIAPVAGFYPTAVAKHANASVGIVFPFLIDFTKSGELNLVWELRCPDFDCHHEIDIVDLSIGNEVDCPKCGFEFFIKETDFFPRFDIDQDYKGYIRQKENFSKKKQVLSLRN